jgi:outer membrane protein assembly factor BamB
VSRWLDLAPVDSICDWPGFRGPRRDAICEAGARLVRQLPAGGLPVLWQIDVEEGYAAAAVRNGRVFVLDYDRQAQADTLRCLSLGDGREIWRNSYPVSISPNHGITRTVPALHEDVVITIGPRCHVACWDLETGQNRWLFSMVQRWGSEERQWYTGQCPLIDGDRLILAPCGPDSLLVALDYRTGEEIWRTPNPRGWKMTHSSVMPMEFAGQRMYVYCGTGGTAGVAAEDGRLLWDETSWRENFATSPSPLVLPEGRIFLSSGYDSVGSMFLQLEQQGDEIVARSAGQLDRRQFNSEQHTPIYFQGHVYGVRKHRGGQFVCLDLQGNELWNSGQDKFGHGPYLIADDLLLIFGEHGELVAAEATPEAYRPVWRFAVYEPGTRHGVRWPSPVGF